LASTQAKSVVTVITLAADATGLEFSQALKLMVSESD
jgi:hypothetical protein